MSISYATELTSIEGYWSLFESTGWNREYRITKEALVAVLGNSWHLIAAYDGDTMVGIGRVVSDGVLHAMVYDLIIDPKYQGRGIGTEILKRLVAKCRDVGIRDVQLFCAEGKRAFYERRGFRARRAGAPGMEFAGVDETVPHVGTPFINIISCGIVTPDSRARHQLS
jgi:GNAT superfamily N-acetyltransferase